MEIKKPNANGAVASAPKGSQSKSTSSAPQGLSLALQREKERAMVIAKMQIALREAAERYFYSNYSPNALPANQDLHPAIIELAKTMDRAGQEVWGDFYVPQGTTDVTMLELPDAGLNVSAFFNQPALQIAGGK